MVDIGPSQYLVRAFIWDPSHFPIYEDPPHTSAHVGDNPDLIWDNLDTAMKMAAGGGITIGFCDQTAR